MRLIALIGAALALSACSSATTHSTPDSPAGTTSGSQPTSTAAPLLDCTNPEDDTQRLVCNDPQLPELDRRLDTAYQQALDRPGTDKAALTLAQGHWAETRDQCAQDPDMRTCLQESYQTRLAQLAIADPATAAPPVISYRCPAEDGPLTAQFYNELDPKTAVLTWRGDQYILFVQLSGSGARYGRQGVEYWEHQGEVQLDFHGTKFVCTTT